MVEVTVQVPEERVGEFYSLVGEWLRESGSAVVGTSQRTEWTTSDSDLARQMWPQLPENPRRLLEVLIEEGEMDGRSLVERLDVGDVSKLVGVHGWVGRVASQFGRKSPVKAKAGADGTTWSISPELAELFKSAKDAAR